MGFGFPLGARPEKVLERVNTQYVDHQLLTSSLKSKVQGGNLN